MNQLKERKALHKAIGLEKGRLLDVGIGGCGCMSFYLAKKGFDVIGIDHSSQAINEARKRSRRQKYKGTLALRRADMTRLPFNKGVFDVVLSFHSLHHVRQPAKAIREMFRVCKKGGRVAILDIRGECGSMHGHQNPAARLARLRRTLATQSPSVRQSVMRDDVLFVARKRKKEKS